MLRGGGKFFSCSGPLLARHYTGQAVLLFRALEQAPQPQCTSRPLMLVLSPILMTEQEKVLGEKESPDLVLVFLLCLHTGIVLRVCLAPGLFHMLTCLCLDLLLAHTPLPLLHTHR